MAFRKSIIVFVLLFFITKSTNATHLYGGELYYKHLTGNKYTVTMVLYGDCAGAASVFSLLYSATPQVQVYNGSTLFRTMSLNVLAGAGTEISPVCPASLGSTTCSGGTVPGVRRFAYADTITLNPSTAWKMRSNGYLTSGSSAGRSSSITNITSPGTSLMSLEATLNNSVLPNSSPIYTTIPTPFFCINVAQEYNPGAVDSNLSDSLAYDLVDGLDASTTPSSTVTYKSGYSATSPLAYTAGTFSFSNTSGQLTFTPNLAQASLVVYRVSEYRGGILVGTSMREMNFIVLGSCSNRSPYGKISSASAGTATNTTVSICKNENFLSFNINPVDSDGNNITVTVAGLPSGSSFSISGSGTKSPTTIFNWNISSVAAGAYIFFVTYQDDGCPLSSKQTVAYTINILPKPSFNVNKLSPATCARKEVFEVVPSGGKLWSFKVFSGGSSVHSLTGYTGNIIDSLPPGTYTFRITNENGCYEEGLYTVIPPPVVSIDSVILSDALCFGGMSGAVEIFANGGIPPFTYKIDASSFTTFSKLTAIKAGTHTVTVRDANFCTKDTIISLAEPEMIVIKTFIKKPTCNAFKNGSITALANGGIAPYQYAIGSASTFTSSNTFGALAAGTYTIYVKDAHDCIQSASVSVLDSIKIRTTISISNVSCFGGSDGQISFAPYIGIAPFSYAMSAGSFGSSPTFTSLPKGTYNFTIKDANGCSLDTAATLAEPTELKLSISPKNPSCFGYSDGIITTSASGGNGTYLFSLNGGVYTSATSFTGLSVGSYKITVKDAKNCTKDTIVSLSQPLAISFTVALQQPLCNGDDNGSILVNATGGTPSYLYAYNTELAQIDNLFKGLRANTYTIIVTDKNGCIKDSIITLGEPSKLLFDKIIILNPTCENYADGSITIEAKAATKPYRFAIDAGNYSNINFFEKLKEHSYLLHIRDSNNCQADSLVQLIGYPKILLDQNPAIPTTCFGKADGSFIFLAKGGNPPLRYTFENSGDTFATANYKNLASQSYLVTVMDTTNCFKQFSTFVPQPQPIKITTDITHNDCTGIDTNGKIVALVSGGTMPYSYRWAIDNSNKSILSGLENGVYALMVKDAHDCVDSLTTEIHYDNCCTPSIPNAFSPNNDGKNDVFRILYKGDVVLKEFSIYNRYGQQIFTTNNVNQGWDGRFNGRDEDLGVYFYMVKMICGNLKNKEMFFKGDVTLIR